MVPGLSSLLWAALAGLAAGFVNALAGGGTLISFPLLILLGLSPVSANVTNALALLPGYLAASLAQKAQIQAQGRRLWLLGPIALAGGFGGALLLLASGEGLFRRLVPFLIFFAVLLLACQAPLRRLLARKEGAMANDKSRPGSLGDKRVWVALSLGGAAVYCGFFGAGVSIIILAVLALAFDEDLGRLNALKQALSFLASLAAAALFAFTGPVDWPFALALGLGAAGGGVLGGLAAGRIAPRILKLLVIILGACLGTYFLVKP